MNLKSEAVIVEATPLFDEFDDSLRQDASGMLRNELLESLETAISRLDGTHYGLREEVKEAQYYGRALKAAEFVLKAVWKMHHSTRS